MKNLSALEINLEKQEKNIQNLKSLLKKETQFLAVVKANAYGHGLVEISKTAIEAGADWLGVVNIDEAIKLREENIHKPILILGDILNDDLRAAANKDISVPIISVAMARQAADTNFDKPLKVHLKIDTGLNRLGLANDEISEVIEMLSSHQNIIIEGVYSHLATVEEKNFDFTKTQNKKFKDAVKILHQNGINNIIKHIAASAATMTLKETHFDMVRCGISIYGLWPSPEIKKEFGRPDFLQPILEFKTQVIQIKKVSAGEKIGYGCTYKAKKEMVIGILPVGYYEGIDRGLSNCGEVLINGVRCPIVGRVAMNMTIIDLTGIDAKSGDEVVVLGKQGDEEITADEIAQKISTINYEIVARLPEHLERRYL